MADRFRDDHWITVNGTHILVEEGKTPAEAVAAHAEKHGNAKSAISPDAGKYPHIAHLLNGAKVDSANHSKNEAKAKAKALRNQNVYASVIKDPKAPRGKQYLVIVPKDRGT
jgi:transcription antitermination factor NusA-like protein